MSDQTNFEESQSLTPQGEVVLFNIITNTGANIFFKSGPSRQYLGDTYEEVPCNISAEKRNVEGEPERPTLSIGGDDIDFSLLKPALFSGQLDGGILIKHVVELDDFLSNTNVKRTSQYRIKQVQDYNRYKINLVLGRFTPASSTTIPYVKYTRPEFPNVQI